MAAALALAALLVVMLTGFGTGTSWLVSGVRETATATATVVEAGHCGMRGSSGAIATFTVGTTTYHASVGCGVSVGDQVVVQYDPADPSRDGHTAAGAAWRLGLGSLALLVAVAIIVRHWWLYVRRR